jgi:hypothetical protein
MSTTDATKYVLTVKLENFELAPQLGLVPKAKQARIWHDLNQLKHCLQLKPFAESTLMCYAKARICIMS